jgi:hypothetical protein
MSQGPSGLGRVDPPAPAALAIYKVTIGSVNDVASSITRRIFDFIYLSNFKTGHFQSALFPVTVSEFIAYSSQRPKTWTTPKDVQLAIGASEYTRGFRSPNEPKDFG